MPVWDVERWITDNDRVRARTTHDLPGLFAAVRPLSRWESVRHCQPAGGSSARVGSFQSGRMK